MCSGYHIPTLAQLVPRSASQSNPGYCLRLSSITRVATSPHHTILCLLTHRRAYIWCVPLRMCTGVLDTLFARVLIEATDDSISPSSRTSDTRTLQQGRPSRRVPSQSRTDLLSRLEPSNKNPPKSCTNKHAPSAPASSFLPEWCSYWHAHVCFCPPHQTNVERSFEQSLAMIPNSTLTTRDQGGFL